MSSPPIAPTTAGSSTRPYLIRALHDWCTDNGFTPYVAVFVDAHVQVPSEYVKNNEIVLNISLDATSSLKLGNDFIEFKARFAGSAREIMVPITHVIAIYARENGQGMAFPTTSPVVSAGPASSSGDPSTADKPGTGMAALPAPDNPSPSPRHSDGVDSKIMQLVPESHAEAGDGSAEPPDPPTTPPRPRPPLKRVK